MFWNGKKEVTKQDIRDIYAEELTKQGAKELWTLNPTNFETREVCPEVAVVTDQTFDSSRLRACYEDEDFTMYLPITVCKNIHEMDGIFKRQFVRVFKEGCGKMPTRQPVTLKMVKKWNAVFRQIQQDLNECIHFFYYIPI